MKKTFRKIITLIICLYGVVARGQDTEKSIYNTTKFKLKTFFKDGMQLSGGISANQTYYKAWGDNRRSPFTHLYSGNINIGVLGKMNIPLSFSFTNQKATLNNPFSSGFPRMQPFNRMQLKPKYKGSTLYLGTSALNFSQYTLSGHRFNGIAYDYRSTKHPLYGTLMYGKLLNAIKVDSSMLGQNRPSYTRIGWAGKIGYKQKQDFVEFIYFQAKDKINTLPYRLDAYNIFPESNLVLGLNFQKILFNNLFIGTEISQTKIIYENFSIRKIWSDAIGLSNKNQNRRALKSTIMYKSKISEHTLEYSRVDPLYRTHGGYFFNADLETYAIKSASHLMDEKLILNADLGYQKDNLDGSKPQSSNRWVWTIDGNYIPSDKLNISLNYSTFSNYSNFQNNFRYLTAILPYQELDTLNYRQINNNVSAMVVFQLPSSKQTKKNITLNSIYQSGNDKQGSYAVKNSLNNMTLSYGLLNETKKNNASIGLNFAKNQTNRSIESLFGPVTSCNGKIYKEKIDWNALLSYTYASNQIFENYTKTSQSIFLGKIGMQSTIFEVHRLSFSAIFFKTTNNLKAPMDLTLNLGYIYQFKLPKSKKE